MSLTREPMRVFAKIYGIVLQLLTYIRTGCAGDPTELILRQETDLQRETAAALGAWPIVPQSIHDPQPPRALPRVLVVIPFRDRWDMTVVCLRALDKQKLGTLDVRVVLVDNGSVEPRTLSGIKSWMSNPPKSFAVSNLRLDEDFNFSRLNNLAVDAFSAEFEPDFILFLNNDVELAGETFLSELLATAQKLPKAGAVGCTLNFPDGRIQHLFAAPGVKLVAAHPLKGRTLTPECAWFQRPRPVAATTGALLLLRASIFKEVGGFDEHFPTLGQDIDLCLKLQKAGYANWVVPWLWATHHEGASRGEDLDRRQIAAMYMKWGDFLTENPYFSRSFSRWSEPPVLTLGWEPPFPWQLLV